MSISGLFQYLFKDRPGDEPGKRALAVIAIFAALLASIGPLVQFGFTPVTLAVLVLTAVVFTWALYHVLHARYRAAALVPFLGGFFIAFTSLADGSGAHSPNWIGMPGAMLLLFLFLDDEVLALVLSSVPVALMLLIGAAEIYGYLPNPGGTTLFFLAEVFATEVSIAMLIFYVFRRQRALLGTARQNEREKAVAVQNARLYEEQVRVALELRKVDEMKAQFLASMSHELRTPLNAVINFVDLVLMGVAGPLTEKQKELLGHSLQSSRHLLQLINDVLDISKIQAGKLSLFVEDGIDLYGEIDAVCRMVGSLLEGKPVEFVLDVDDNLPAVSGDRRRIRQILLNLLTNAAKFTQQGSITLSAKRRPGNVTFAVIDTGPGIPAASQQAIFEAFVQTPDGAKVEGSGLGLPISRSLAEAHGGKLWVESHPGEGSIFYFVLPREG